MLNKERWAVVDGYDGLYMISDAGNVVSTRCKKQLTPMDNGNGYLIIGLKVNGSRENKYIHTMVAEAFISNRPAGCVVNHKDHNKQNNSVDNLEWCTQMENVLMSAHLMRHPKSKHKQSATGEKYIYLDKKGRYRFHFMGHDKRFATIDLAKQYKHKALANG